jgi:hypothetical protein
MNLTGCEIRFVLFGLDGRGKEWSLTGAGTGVLLDMLTSPNKCSGVQSSAKNQEISSGSRPRYGF